MRQQWVRSIAALGGLMIVVTLSGCVIEDPTSEPQFYSWVKIQPGDALSAGPLDPAPPGTIYQLWGANLIGNALADAEPLVRFQWDPENYVARDESGEIINLTTGSGLDVGVNVYDYSTVMMTIEPLEGVSAPGFGPIVLFGNPFQSQERRDMFSPIDILQFLGLPPVGEPAYTLVSQSNKKENPDADWRDGSEGFGIWFAEPLVSDRIVIDPEVEYLTLGQVVVFPEVDTGVPYTVWINLKDADSSFSNFGNAFAGQEPDLLFLDGLPRHDSTRTGPQVAFGEEPIFNPNNPGEVIGYRYVSDAGDVCDVRIDHPWLSHCDTDPFESLLFHGDSAVIIDGDTVGFVYFSEDRTDTCMLRWDFPELSECTDSNGVDNIDDFYELMFSVATNTNRQGTTTEGDTAVTATIPLIGPLQALLWEMEAWLVFTPESGLKPLSLGRFDVDHSPGGGPTSIPGAVNGEGIDQSNPFTFVAGFDTNFTFPGEDFLTDSLLAFGITPPLNVIEDERAIKIWVTLEPANRIWVPPTFDPETGVFTLGFFQKIDLDWAPEDPFSQLIVFSAWLPTSEAFAVVDDTLFAPATRPMIYRDLNPNTDPLTSLNEGHRWPQMTVFLSNEGP